MLCRSSVGPGRCRAIYLCIRIFLRSAGVRQSVRTQCRGRGLESVSLRPTCDVLQCATGMADGRPRARRLAARARRGRAPRKPAALFSLLLFETGTTPPGGWGNAKIIAHIAHWRPATNMMQGGMDRMEQGRCPCFTLHTSHVI